MELYQFDGISSELELVPLAARRALDRAGRKLSLGAWRHLDHAARRGSPADDADRRAA